MMSKVITVGCISQVASQVITDSLLVDLPGAVVVRHTMNHDACEGGSYSRVVYTMSGQLESTEQVSISCCVSCSVREDEVKHVLELASSGWSTIIVALPPAVPPSPFVAQLAEEISAQNADLSIAAVLAAVDPASIETDLLNDLLLVERGLALGDNDSRSVGETLASIIDYSDIVCTTDRPTAADTELLTHATATTTGLWLGLNQLGARAALGLVHDIDLAESRLDPLQVDCRCTGTGSQAWTLELHSPRPFHPRRLLDQIELLGGGRLRARGCFWLPTRPDRICGWSGAGGQLYIGDAGPWGEVSPRTRLLITGIDPADRDRVKRAFDDCLLTSHETQLNDWPETDGLEDWLG